MTFAYNYNHRWRKFAKENFANLVKSRKSRTLNLAKFSHYTVVLNAVNQLHSTTLPLTLTYMYSLSTRAWGMYTVCTLIIT